MFSMGLFGFWWLAIVVFGGPVWALAHYLNRTNWYDAIIFGVVIPFSVLFFPNGRLDWSDQPAPFPILIGGIGGVVGLSIWAVAYYRADLEIAENTNEGSAR